MQVHESKVFCSSLDSNVEEQISNIKLIMIQIPTFMWYTCEFKAFDSKN